MLEKKAHDKDLRQIDGWNKLPTAVFQGTLKCVIIILNGETDYKEL